MASAALSACAAAVAPSASPLPTHLASREPSRTTAPSPTPPATPSASPARLTSERLREAVEIATIRTHLEALQAIADANGGNRASGTDGYAASADYVTARLQAAGYRVEPQTFSYDDGTGTNLIAELPGTDPARVVMLGAHLDSVAEGPGINDNGSGVATVLAIAEALPPLGNPAATIRLAFWDAEEPGRQGSSAYVAGLGGDETARIEAYLNLDIVGSPNFVRFVYSEPAAMPGSAAITDLFAAHFATQGLAWEPIDLAGKTDHAAFTAAGIPTGGLFSGGTEPKTAAQTATFGGTAGAPADPCIHRVCDTTGSINDTVLAEMADATAHVLVVLASAPGSG